MKLKSLPTAAELREKYVLVRGSLNLPIAQGKVVDQFRIERLLLTLTLLQQAGAKTLLIGHIGRGVTDSLKPVYEALNEHLPVVWGGAILSDEFKQKKDALKSGEVLMAENLRQDHREKENDGEFGKAIASLADIYINDAFSNAHREHASMVGIPKYLPAYPGVNFQNEIEELSSILTPDSPSLFLLGGAKFQTKLPLIEKCLEIYDQVFVGGALANDIFAARGLPVGQSLLSHIALDNSLISHPNLLTPVDVTVEGPTGKRVCEPADVQPQETIKDAGSATVAMLESHINNAKTILWNGPLGQFEAGYRDMTEAVATAIAKSGAYSVVGGGDTLASIERLGIDQEFSFLSTGGGAMLSFLQEGTTPAIEFLKAS